VEKGEIIYQAKKKAMKKPRLALTIKIVANVVGISAKFLAHVVAGKGNIETADRHLEQFWRTVLENSQTSLMVRGKSRLVRGQSYIYMSNHPSIMDIPVLFAAVPGSLRMVAKQQLTRFPIFGQALIYSGFIPIDRSNRKKAIQQLETAKQRVDEGISIWIAPEGTRSRSRTMRPFKKGGFHVAIDLETPIVPIYIHGSDNVVPADSSIINTNQTIILTFGEPIETNNLTKKDIPELATRVREAIQKLEKDLKSEIEKEPLENMEGRAS